MEHFVETLENNLKEAVEGLTPMKVLCIVLVRGCLSKREYNEYYVRTEYNSLKVDFPDAFLATHLNACKV